MTQDHWSRGNGWGIFALTELIQELPSDHPRYPEVAKEFQSLLNAIFAYQDDEGCWHQELTRPDSYVETSGAGLFLYALAAAQNKGLNNHSQQIEQLLQGLRGLSRYIALDGSIHHTSQGCLSPGEGTIADYMARGPQVNDRHAFGPVSLAFGQAYINGLSDLPSPPPSTQNQT